MPRLPLPKYLCIDEKHFEGDTNGKYCVVLSDFFTGEVIDVLPDRQMLLFAKIFGLQLFKLYRKSTCLHNGLRCCF